LAVRTNARSFELAMFKFTDIQIARQLSDDEVKRLKFHPEEGRDQIHRSRAGGMASSRGGQPRPRLGKRR
jgi:hypothetical protein